MTQAANFGVTEGQLSIAFFIFLTGLLGPDYWHTPFLTIIGYADSTAGKLYFNWHTFQKIFS